MSNEYKSIPAPAMPSRPQDDDDEDIQHPPSPRHDDDALNISGVSNVSGNSQSIYEDDEDPVPSSLADLARSIPTLNSNKRFYPSVDFHHIDSRCTASYYYNNELATLEFLQTNLFTFVVWCMISNLLHWYDATKERVIHTPWFRHWGYRRLFLEALEQALTRLPLPRLFNLVDYTAWINSIHQQSRDVRLPQHLWQTHPSATRWSNPTYHPIRTFWSFSHANNTKAFICGIQDGSTGTTSGGWALQQRFWADFPQNCFNFISHSLDILGFHVLSSYEVRGTNSVVNPSSTGVYTIDYSRIQLARSLHPIIELNESVRTHQIPLTSRAGLAFLVHTNMDQPRNLYEASPSYLSQLTYEHTPLTTLYSPPNTLIPQYVGIPQQPFPCPSTQEPIYNLMPHNLSDRITDLTQQVNDLLHLNHQVENQQNSIDKLRDKMKALTTKENDHYHQLKSYSEAVESKRSTMAGTLIDHGVAIEYTLPNLVASQESYETRYDYLKENVDSLRDRNLGYYDRQLERNQQVGALELAVTRLTNQVASIQDRLNSVPHPDPSLRPDG